MNNSERKTTRRDKERIVASFFEKRLPIHLDLIPLSRTQNITQPTTYRQVS
jgi:hypothetical protein